MAEVNAAELEAQADAAFVHGFTGTPPEIPEKVVDEPKVEDDKPAPDDAAPPAAAAPAAVPEKPQYVRLTKQEWDNTKAAAGKVSTLESQVAKLMGAIPKGDQIVQQVLDKVQSATPAGSPIKLTKEDLAELSEDFPELSEKLLAGLGRAFERASVKGTGAPQPAKETPPAQPVDVNALVEKALMDREADELAEAYPDWSDIVGRPKAGEAPNDKAPWRLWLATQPAEYQKKINETKSPAVVRASIDKFKAQSNSAPPSPRPDKAAARRAVIADAETPRADGSPPPLNRPTTADEAFEKGFKAVKAH